MRIPTLVLLACTPTNAFAQHAQPETGPSWEVSSGFEYESGDYGSGVDIEILSVPNSLSMSIGRVQLVAAIPYTGSKDLPMSFPAMFWASRYCRSRSRKQTA